MLEQEPNQIYEAAQDTQTQVEAFSHIKKDQYLSKVFCWIGTCIGYNQLEQANTPNVIKFYNTFPHLINELYTPNHWNPLMYAVRYLDLISLFRYGNKQLIQFLFQKGMKTNIQGIYNHVSIIHSAVYSGEVSILAYVLNSIYMNANPSNCQTSPLKISMKTGNPKMVELLIAKGAYYTFGDVFNNLIPKQTAGDDTNRYLTIDSGKEISNALVVQDSTIKDCPIKETLRWARIRQTMLMRHYAEKMSQITKKYGQTLKDQVQIKEEQPEQQQYKIQEQIQLAEVIPPKVQQKVLDQKHRFFGLSQILLNDDYYDNILRVLVNKGDSILIKNDPIEQKQVKDTVKQPTQVQNSQQKK